MKQFEIFTAQFDSVVQTTQQKCDSAEQALNVLRVPEVGDCFVRVSISEGNVSWGEFELWCAGQRAWARILEHREHEARELQTIPGPIGSIAFKDEDGSSFTVPTRSTVPRDLATAALLEWLQGRERPTMLNWE